MNQKLTVPLEFMSYAQYISQLISVCKKHHYSYEIITYEKFEKVGLSYPIYRLDLFPNREKSICLVSGVHGYEVAGPLTILKLLKTHFFTQWQNTSISIFPILNPSSYDLKQRYDDDGRDLNALYKATLVSKNYLEVQSFYQSVVNRKFDLFLSLHEDFDEQKFYAYVFDKTKNTPSLIYQALIEELKKTTEIYDQETIYGTPISAGLVTNSYDQSLEQFMFTHALAPLSLATETPMKLPLSSRMDINQKIIEFFFQNLPLLKK